MYVARLVLLVRDDITLCLNFGHDAALGSGGDSHASHPIERVRWGPRSASGGVLLGCERRFGNGRLERAWFGSARLEGTRLGRIGSSLARLRRVFGQCLLG